MTAWVAFSRNSEPADTHTLADKTMNSTQGQLYPQNRIAELSRVEAGSIIHADVSSDPKHAVLTSRRNSILQVLIVVSAFNFYWQTSYFLLDMDRITYFGADGNVYLKLAQKTIDDQILLFHPFAALLSVVWMKIFTPLTEMLPPEQILSAMFAAIGALGVGAAFSIFKAMMPRVYALPCTMIYAVSLSIWYFSSIDKSKIIEAAFACLYIAIYIQLRKSYTSRLSIYLTITYALACFNSIISALLVLIPVIDIFLRNYRMRDALRDMRWVFYHVLPAPIVLLLMEAMINSHILGQTDQAKGANHFDLFITFASLADHSIINIYNFVINWFFFSVAAPAPNALYAYPIWPDYHGYWEPELANYFGSLVTVILITSAGLAGVYACFLPKAAKDREWSSLLYGLIGFSIARALFFFTFAPPESLLYSPPAVICHLVIFLKAFVSSKFAYKKYMLYFLLATLLVTNIRFIL